MKITKFEDVEAWRTARELVNAIYKATRTFAEDPDLRRQTRRRDSSIMSNIAEGFDAGSDPEFRRFLRIARRSGTELQSHFYIALDQKYVPQNAFQEVYVATANVKRLIGGFLRYLTGKSPKT